MKTYWNAPLPVSTDVKARYELVAEDGTVLKTHERRPAMRWYASSHWKRGEYPIDLVKFRIPPDAREGRTGCAVTGDARRAARKKALKRKPPFAFHAKAPGPRKTRCSPRSKTI
ncbi:MAG: hypothetical protein M5R36_12170 [Deltaproteobacteria bacterium]|nr:hypothetical protein [Deltaproteobacteria bacterium]